ncbi:MAG: hypothetical protein ACRDJH_01130 [Thermomicrobiales bacterium]
MPSDAEEERDGQLRIRLGLTMDSQERFVVSGVTVDVTTRGAQAARAVVRRNWEQLKPSALAMVRQHFTADPADIPDPGEVKSDLLVSLGRAPDGQSA